MPTGYANGQPIQGVHSIYQLLLFFFHLFSLTLLLLLCFIVGEKLSNKNLQDFFRTCNFVCGERTRRYGRLRRHPLGMVGIRVSFKNYSIDGKKTYFDISPTSRMPPGYANGQPIQANFF